MGHSAPVDDQFEPETIDVVKDEAVTITYRDGHVAGFPIRALRLNCPCATCRTLRDQHQVVWPRPGSPEPLLIEAAELHGGWALNITWNDGHSTGQFPFESLRRWHDGAAVFGPDSGLSASE